MMPAALKLTKRKPMAANTPVLTQNDVSLNGTVYLWSLPARPCWMNPARPGPAARR
jgi:hypothetical protein